MDVKARIKAYIESQPEPKRGDMREVHRLILKAMPGCKLWFLDGKDGEGKTVSNPNIGYGLRTLSYADGKTRDFYRVGLSANTAGLSVYVLGIEDKAYLARTFGKTIGKASVTGYCIRFKALRDISVEALAAAIRSAPEAGKGKVEASQAVSKRREAAKPAAAVNKAWHDKHRMPANASLEVRSRWHLAHRENCRCRKMPATVVAYLRKRKA
jgi:hypothetical protein